MTRSAPQAQIQVGWHLLGRRDGVYCSGASFAKPRHDMAARLKVDLRESNPPRYGCDMRQIILEDFNLEAAERRLCVEALGLAGNIIGAAQILGITRHALKRRIIKLHIEWSRSRPPPGSGSATSLE